MSEFGKVLPGIERLLSGTELPSEEYLDREELEFVSGFDALMDAAHYSRLSRQEWETAAQEEFTVSSSAVSRARRLKTEDAAHCNIM